MTEPVNAERRTFLKSIGRLLLAVGLAGGAAALLLRDPQHSCTRNGLCRGCSTFARCDLPQALSARQAGVR